MVVFYFLIRIDRRTETESCGLREQYKVANTVKVLLEMRLRSDSEPPTNSTKFDYEKNTAPVIISRRFYKKIHSSDIKMPFCFHSVETLKNTVQNAFTSLRQGI